MIRQLRFAIIGLAAVAGILHAQASFRAHIPFAFVAAGQLLEAGEYTVEIDMIPGLLVLKADHGKEPVVMKLMPSTAPAERKLVFHRYGDQYFLTEISGHTIPQTTQERALARQAEPEHTTISATPR